MSTGKRGRSLADVMASIDDDTPSEAQAVYDAEIAPVHDEERSEKESGGQMGIVPINILVAPDDRKRLRQLSLDTGLSLQKLGHEAWNMLLHKRGLSALKAVSANVPSGRSRAR
jgi:hypothetical protein